jgi:hypothetical protein
VGLSATLAVLATFAVYRPDRKLPFDFLDFSEFLSLLQGGGSFFDRLSEMTTYYASQGRFNVVGYALLAAKWGFWGDNTPAWQWARFVAMWVAIPLTYLLLRRVSVSRLAAIIGSAVFLFAPPAFDGWTRLTMAEPLGLVLLLAACLLALRPVDGPQGELRIGLGFAAICVCIVLLKEMLVATLLLPLLLMLALRPSSAGFRRQRLRTLLGAMIASVPIASIPVVLTAARAPRDAYTTAFGSQMRPLSDALAQWSLAIFPFDPATNFPARLTGLALLAFFAVVVTGWTIRLRMPNAEHGFQPRRLLAIALLFPLVGTLIYLPWPSWNRFYSIPFLLSGAILAAVAFDAIVTWSRRAFIAACCVWGFLLVFAAADASAQANRLAARQLTNLAVVSRLSALQASFDTVFVATDQTVPAAWQGLGPTLERYGRAFGLDMPVVVNEPCQESRTRSSANKAAIVAYGSHCPGFAATDPIVVRYRRLRISTTPLTTDSLRVDFIVPPVPRGR